MIKLNLLSNGKAYNWGFWRSFLYFLFASLDPLDGIHIKVESRSFKQFGSKKVCREFYTFRAFWAYCRYMPAYALRKKRERVAEFWKIHPRLAYCVGAIAFNATVSDTVAGSVTSETLSHTVGSGNNRIVFTGAGYSDANASVSSATYAGAGMTSSVSYFASAANSARIHILYKVAPTSGANDCVLNFSQATAAGNRGGFGVIDYTGVDQSSPQDVTATNDSGGTGVTSIDASLTTTVANDWVLNTVWWGGGGTLSVGQGETSRWSRNSGIENAGADKALTTATNYNTGWDSSVSNSVAIGAVAFKPSADTFIPKVIIF